MSDTSWAKLDTIIFLLGGKEYHTMGRERARMAVRIRDKFTCQSCGAVRELRRVVAFNEAHGAGKMKLHDVHHLHGMCGKKSTGYDSVDDISGLITLCHKCHYNHHQFSQNLLKKSALAVVKNLERATAFIAFVEAGQTMAEIAKTHGLSRERVRQIIRGAGYSKRIGGKKRTPTMCVCKNCQKSFPKGQTKGLFCSRQCCATYRRANALCKTPEERREYSRKRTREWLRKMKEKNPSEFKELTRRRNQGERGLSIWDLIPKNEQTTAQ